MGKKFEPETLLWLPLFFPIFVLDVILAILLKLKGDADQNGTLKMQSVVTASSSSSSSSSSSQTEKGKPRRSPCVLDGKLVDSFSDAGTVYEMVKNATEKYGNHVAMQYYEFVELKKIKATDRFPSKIFSHNLRQITYNELGPKIANYGRGLRVIGMEPQPTNCSSNFDTATGKFTLVIFEDTCPQWSISMQGALSQSMVVATCYATLGDEAVISAVNETGATAIVVNWKKTKQFCELAQQMPTLQTIIASTHELPPAGAEIYKPSSSSNVQVVSFDDIMKMGQDSTFEPKPPKPSDVAVIMYTSGSTGKPKGVVMKHSHVIAGLAGMVTNVTLREREEIYVSYLPLAHILALQVENIIFKLGGTSCYTDPRQLPKDMPRFQPTIMCGVPKVWEMLQMGLEKKLSKGPKPLYIIFQVLLSWKIKMLQLGMDTPVSNIFFWCDQ